MLMCVGNVVIHKISGSTLVIVVGFMSISYCVWFDPAVTNHLSTKLSITRGVVSLVCENVQNTPFIR